MQEYEFDKTRKAIRVDKLQEEEKRLLLEKFKEKGGKILKEKAISKEIPDFKESKSNYKEEKKLPSQVYREQKLKEAERIAYEKAKREEIIKKASSFFALWVLKLNLWLKKIITFDGKFFRSEFLSFLNLEFRRSLLELNIITLEFFSEPKFLDHFKKKFPPLCLELLKRVYLLHNRMQLADLTSHSSERNEILDSIRIPLFHYLKQFYILASYKELALKTLLESVDIIESIQKKSPDIYKNKKKRIQQSWDILMYNAFPKFILISQFLEGKKLEPFTSLYEEEILNLSPKEKIDPTKFQDYQNVSLDEIIKTDKKATSNEQNEKQEKPVDPEEEKKQKAIEKTYKYGLKFLNLLSLEELRKKYDTKQEFKDITLYDKIFITFLYINFFDDQFGFIFMTNKLQLNTFYRGDLKVNLKDEMSILYEDFRKIYEYFRKYYSDYLEYKKVIEDTLIDKKSIDYQKKLDYFEKRRIASARETYKVMLNYIKKCERVLVILFKDIREKKQIVTNPDDIIELEFDPSSSIKKIMHQKPIKEIIRDAYATSFSILLKMEKKELYIEPLEFTKEEFDFFFNESLEL